jgi:hypothetical protein
MRKFSFIAHARLGEVKSARREGRCFDRNRREREPLGGRGETAIPSPLSFFAPETNEPT